MLRRVLAPPGSIIFNICSLVAATCCYQVLQHVGFYRSRILYNQKVIVYPRVVALAVGARCERQQSKRLFMYSTTGNSVGLRVH